MRLVRIAFGVALVAVVAAALYMTVWQRKPRDAASAPVYSFAELTGSVFLPLPRNALGPPQTRVLAVPPFDDSRAIWGATGRDFRGHIWIGVSAVSDGASARLFEYVPDEDVWRDRGEVLDKLKFAGLSKPGMGQIKIHSKIVPAGDGWLYFASTDEQGERSEPPVPPRWGGHLWRINPERGNWEHLLAVPEGLVAASGAGRYVYTLGYWGHVLYQFDTTARAVARVAVGSVDGHVSRNFLADVRGHAYVPRLSAQPGGVAVSLVEYDERLKELAATPLAHYLGKVSPGENHGIIGLAYLPDGRMVFATHIGFLYLITPGEGPARVTELGWLHPQGENYTPALFSFGGTEWLAGIAQLRSGAFEWIVYEMRTQLSRAFPLDTKGLKDVLLYGSITRDDAGRVYLGGWAADANGSYRPLFLQVDPGR